jgi:hypothetical protein
MYLMLQATWARGCNLRGSAVNQTNAYFCTCNCCPNHEDVSVAMVASCADCGLRHEDPISAGSDDSQQSANLIYIIPPYYL